MHVMVGMECIIMKKLPGSKWWADDKKKQQQHDLSFHLQDGAR